MPACRERGLKLEVHTRQGTPFKVSDLRRVAAARASTIIVLHPEGAAGSAEDVKASVAMGLTALGVGSQGGQRVVVQMTGMQAQTCLCRSGRTGSSSGGWCL
jgi:hypothetical protein